MARRQQQDPMPLPVGNLGEVMLDLVALEHRLGLKPLSPETLTALAGFVLEAFETGAIPATTETAQAPRRRPPAPSSRCPQRDIILFGGALPLPVYALRLPAGTRWETAMRAARRLVKRLTNTSNHKAAPCWYVDGDAPDWETTKQPRFIYNAETDEFEALEG